MNSELILVASVTGLPFIRVLLLVGLVASGASLQCHQCSSHTDPGIRAQFSQLHFYN